MQIGNAVINDDTDTKGMYDYFESHALISEETLNKIKKYCNFSSDSSQESDDGDTDGRVPVTSTKYSINKMKLAVKTKWHPWFLSGEVGGYTQVYEGNLTFATVRGAGHQVPSYQPVRALSLIMHFLGGTELPNTSRQ
ncbi:Serine carboxypeptidase-like 40 [Forsythia ovata]|uniref:Serine carboxypeptidase-like 40 n=1 Tax=Forsythia ovata TaxID=205694 RepID=A0ABD1TPE6_9LAMI